MKLPKRPKTHIVEAASWKLLQALAPDTWIVREATERDYGIDAYIELANEDDEITGNLILVQLKGTRSIEWKGTKTVKARSPQIETSTANYWLRLPVPVFLFVADLTERNIFYVSVEGPIRRNFEKLAHQETMTFELLRELSLTSDIGMALVPWFYGRERMHEQFAFHITNLISHVYAFQDFISENQGRDCFMEVETEQHLQFRALHESCRMAAFYLDREWNMETLPQLYRKDQEAFGAPHVRLHEQTLDYALQKLETIFPALVKKAVNLVANTQSAYWRTKDPILHSICSGGELGWTMRRMEQDLATGSSSTS